MMKESPPFFPARGYVEGYYGRLLGWDDRHRIIDRLAGNGMNAYLYAPKEDPFHRVDWRTAWPDDWVREFTRFCDCLLYTSPSPRDLWISRMPSSA